MLKDSAADLWHFLTSNRIKILLKRYIFNHYKSCIPMMLLARLRATKPRNLRAVGNPGIAGTGTFYWLPQCSAAIPSPQSHILISANRSPGYWCFHASSIPLQPKDPFSGRSIWTEKLLHLKLLLNGIIHFPLFTLKALSIPHKCPVSLCKQHLVLSSFL